MEEWLVFATKQIALIIDAMALTVIAMGALEAFILSIRLVLRPSATNFDKRAVWLRLARWFVAALT
jgi:hypothetical protein